MKINKGSKIQVHYRLHESDAAGELIESTRAEEPMEFVMGEDPMLPAFEEALMGKSAGDRFMIQIPAADAYGPELEELFTEVPKSDFISEGELDEGIFEIGEIVPMETEDGEVLEGVICEVNLNSVVLDFNHPLAGIDLFFEGEIVSVA